MAQLVGEYGERKRALRGVALLGVALFEMALRGDAPMDEYGDEGIRSFRRVAGVFEDVEDDRERVGRMNGVGGTSGAD